MHNLFMFILFKVLAGIRCHIYPDDGPCKVPETMVQKTQTEEKTYLNSFRPTSKSFICPILFVKKM